MDASASRKPLVNKREFAAAAFRAMFRDPETYLHVLGHLLTLALYGAVLYFVAVYAFSAGHHLAWDRAFAVQCPVRGAK